MVRPPKASDLSKPANNFRKVNKKINIKNPEIEEKYRNKASFRSKLSEKKKINMPVKKASEEDFSSTPPSLRKDTINPKISIKLSKRSNIDIANKPLSKGRGLLSSSAPNKDGTTKRTTSSATRTQKSRISQSKNKIPAIAKSEPMKRLADKETTIKKQKHKGKITNPSPPPESYFKPEGKVRTSSQPNKVVGRLITPKLIEERCEKVEQELKTKLAITRLEESNVSLMTHYCVGMKSNHIFEKKPVPKVLKKYKKSKIPARKKRTSKTDVRKKVTEIKDDKKMKRELTNKTSEEKQIAVREIKHNDSFVIAAKKLQNSAKSTKRPKPEIIRLFKRRDTSKNTSATNPLKSCLKKNSDGHPKQNFGEEGSYSGLIKRTIKNSQIPRLSREKAALKV